MRGLVVRLVPLHLYRIRGTPQSLSAAVSAMFVSACRPNYPSVLMPVESLRFSGESAERPSHMSHTLERDLDQRTIALLLKITERRRTSARRTELRRSEIRSRVGRGGPANTAIRQVGCDPTPARSGEVSHGEVVEY